ncbi:MAG: hypothetical protein ACE5IH_08835 [Thermodesulfobacteriota bacterium]
MGIKTKRINGFLYIRILNCENKLVWIKAVLLNKLVNMGYVKAIKN